jgi:hypothetical protein
MDFRPYIAYTIKMDCCACCNWQIYNEKDACYYEQLGLVVCETCYEALIKKPTLEEIMAALTIS